MNNHLSVSRVLLGLSLATTFLLPESAAQAGPPSGMTSGVIHIPTPIIAWPSFTVTTTADNDNACTTRSSSCSLRGAIAAADEGLVSNPTITFAIPSTDPNYDGGKPTIKLGEPHLSVSRSLAIDTQGQSVSVLQNFGDSVFAVTSGAVTIKGLTIMGGGKDPGFDEGLGGGGGVEMSGGTLTLANCCVAANEVEGVGNFGGQLNVIASSIQGNDIGIVSRGTLTAVTNTTICDNGDSGISVFAPVTVTNSTICGNYTSSPQGSGNAPSGGFIQPTGGGGGIWNGYNFPVTLLNTLVLGNHTDNGRDLDVFGAFDASGTSGNNLIGSASGSTGFNAAHHDQVGTDGAPIPLSSVLATSNGSPVLAYNGGPTETIALIAGSRAIDSGNDVVTQAPYNLTTDQRGPGYTRDFGSHVDIGAYEYIHITIPPLGPVHIPGLDAVKQESAPVAVSVTPSEAVSPVNESELIETTFRSEEGASAIAGARLAIGHASDPSRALFSVYDGATNLFYLADASGAQTGGYAPGSDNLITTQLGTLNMADTTATKDGDQLVINWDLTPSDKLLGHQDLGLLATGTNGLNSGWHDLGSWTIFGGSQDTPAGPAESPSGHAS